MAVNLNEIKTGYISRSEISSRYHLSDTSISKYQTAFADFPTAEIQRVKFCQKPIQIFKTADIDNWFNLNNTAKPSESK